ncbi:alpha/beta hydrolase [Tolypothrix sp. FACHB-123]|uniref:alpha/beta fold hydrolase n=1 Tax=Tolypothrix sp. FACHB-123 TaxID=2692868 RepID=UPI001685E7C2|nr:alpha/beta hydrolase [Tolypothrix sp. FACHB-123]MBD2354293.1 alpha/beta hydrolase [Tolypothrix sp. FACHB-123]
MDTLFRNSRRKLSQGLLFWREAGQGMPIIFLHGAWNDSSQWVSVMESMSQHFHCFALDLLGCGESDNPNIHYSVELQVECLAEFLEALKLEKVYLVGHSLGGWIAGTYALKYPEQIEGLILLSPEGVAIEGEEKRWQKMQWLLDGPKLLFKILRSLLPIVRIFGLHKKIEQSLQKRKTLLQHSTACQLLFNRSKPEIAAEYLQDRLHLLTNSVLILQGGKDTADALAKSKTYKQRLPKAELKIIPHAGDNLPESCVGLVAEDIQEYVKAKSSRII